MVCRQIENTVCSYANLYRNMLSQSYVDQLERGANFMCNLRVL